MSLKPPRMPHECIARPAKGVFGPWLTICLECSTIGTYVREEFALDWARKHWLAGGHNPWD